MNFWVIACRNFPEKIMIAENGESIFLDPNEARKQRDIKNIALGIKSANVYRIEGEMIKETDFGD